MTPVNYLINRRLEKSLIEIMKGRKILDVALEYVRDISTRVFIAKENERIIGILDSSYDDGSFMTKKTQIVNVGDIYVLEEYRGKKLAQGLLQFANDQFRADGIEKLWVEHGTTNPNARGFWDKYFEVYSYNLTRELSTDIFSE